MYWKGYLSGFYSGHVVRCADVSFTPISVNLAGPTSVVGSTSVYSVTNVTVPLKDPFDCLQTQVLLWAVLQPQALGMYDCPAIPVVISASYCHQCALLYDKSKVYFAND
jgi:hypothetical protein